MSRAPGSMACHACRAAKRKCEKQTPHCLRCRRRGVDCTYPTPRPTSFVFCGALDAHDHDASRQDCHVRPSSDSVESERTHGATKTPPLQSCLDGVSSATSSLVGAAQPAFTWLLSPAATAGPDPELEPESQPWRSEPFPRPDGTSYHSIDLGRHVLKVNRWLRQWVDTGSNPFIHPRLYRTRFPRCVQDAYMALTCYLKKTPSNSEVVNRIIEDRAEQLVKDYAISPTTASWEGNPGLGPLTALDSLEHVARVQALLVYQFLGLYDGNIRMRYLAETRIPVLYSWTEQMLAHCDQTLCPGSTMVAAEPGWADLDASLVVPVASPENLRWYNWILSETMRRTRIIALGIQVMYWVLQQDGPVPCENRVPFRAHSGIWEASSASAWDKLFSKVDVSLVEAAEARELFTRLTPENVNDFATFVLEVSCGAERTENWRGCIDDKT